MKTKKQLIAEWLDEQRNETFPIDTEDFYFDVMDDEERELFGSLENFQQAIDSETLPN